MYNLTILFSKLKNAIKFILESKYFLCIVLICFSIFNLVFNFIDIYETFKYGDIRPKYNFIMLNFSVFLLAFLLISSIFMIFSEYYKSKYIDNKDNNKNIWSKIGNNLDNYIFITDKSNLKKGEIYYKFNDSPYKTASLITLQNIQNTITSLEN